VKNEPIMPTRNGTAQDTTSLTIFTGFIPKHYRYNAAILKQLVNLGDEVFDVADRGVEFLAFVGVEV
jgi:hypothetical protein